MLVSLPRIADLLRYPSRPSRHICLAWEGDALKYARSKNEDFPIVANQPVLIDFTTSIVPKDWFTTARQGVSIIGERSNLARSIKGMMTGSRRASAQNIQRLRRLLQCTSTSPVLLMVGAGTIGAGCEALYDDQDIAQIAFDIYPSSTTQFVADAHQIPLASESMDAVVIQAVLEHVLNPAAVVAEVFRVLKPNGLVYAETPFMQQVHEGAYDFTRFTELGHRWLWRHFEEIRRDVVGGPGLSLYWSVRYFSRALLRERRIADMLSLPFLLFPLFDRLLPLTRKIEGANGVCFLGRKSAVPLGQGELISRYLGPKT